MRLLIVLAIAIPALIWRGIVLSALWCWFITPLGPPAIETAHAIGISLLVSLVTMKHEKAKDADEPLEAVVQAVIYPAVFLAVGAIVHAVAF